MPVVTKLFIEYRPSQLPAVTLVQGLVLGQWYPLFNVQLAQCLYRNRSLSGADQMRNAMIAVIRSDEAHSFAICKRYGGLARARFMGLVKIVAATIGELFSRSEMFNVNAGVAFVLLLLGSCDSVQTDTQWVALRGQTMGTSYTVKARIAPDELTPTILNKDIRATLELANKIMSNWIDHSEISRFNASVSTNWQEISAHLLAVMHEALLVNLQSHGRFDVTLSPLIDLWGFGPDDDGKLPDAAQIRDALRLVGQSSLLEFKNNPPRMRKHNGAVSINLSAIAKGYAVDMIALRLEKHGIEDYLVEIGGDLRTHGVNAESQPWRVGIERPDAKGKSLQRIVSVNNMGLATSGDYRKYIKIRGKRLPHIIDPSSGYPVTHDLASVTVLASNAMRADALATALLVMGEKKGLALAEQLKLAAYFITRKEKGFETSSSSMFIVCCADPSSRR